MRYRNSATPCAIAVIAFAPATPAAARDALGTTAARFEQQYLIFVIDHHLGALRMAELAAGTEVHRSAALMESAWLCKAAVEQRRTCKAQTWFCFP